jgi:hypothetical protein
MAPGKTTLTRMVGDKAGYVYFSFDEAVILKAAETDPTGFVLDLPERVILIDRESGVNAVFSQGRYVPAPQSSTNVMCSAGSSRSRRKAAGASATGTTSLSTAATSNSPVASNRSTRSRSCGK